jgi:3-oxoadipate enol-lactonase
MPLLNYKGRNIYYEINGVGKPILILNGIMMSTKSWEPFVKTLSKDNMLIRLDFFDQGQSDQLDNSIYTQDLQVDLIKALLSELRLSKINIVGISYGGEVALLFATRYPKSLDRMVLFNTAAYTSPWLKSIGEQWKQIGKTLDGSMYYKATIPVIYSPSYYEEKLDWMKKREAMLVPIFSNKNFIDKMERLTNSAEPFDVREKLHLIDSPVLIVSSDEDYLTPIKNQFELKRLIKNSEHVIIPGAGHASMYEKPLLFTTLVLGFINALDSTYNI